MQQKPTTFTRITKIEYEKKLVETKTQKWNKHKNPVEDSKENLKDLM